MKQLLLFLMTIATIILFGGCPGNTGTPKSFPMTILVSDRIVNNKTDKIPEEIITFCLPISSKYCPKSIYTPDPLLKRVSEDKMELSLKTNIEAGFAGNPSNKNLIESNINKHLKELPIGENFSLPNESDIDYVGTIRSFITEHKNAKYFCFSKIYSDSLFCGQKIFSDFDTLKTAVAQALCEHPSASIIIIYNPPQSSPDEEIKHLRELQKENEEAINDPKKIDQVKHELQEYSSSNPNDYRPIYELVKNSIYGKEEHHIAFRFLNEAVDIAIDNGEAANLKADIGNDLAKGKENDIWKLAHGHEHDWKPIMEALSTNNAEKLQHSH